MIRSEARTVLLILLVVASGCQTADNTRLTCKYDQIDDRDISDEWLANNITSWDELPNETKRNLTGAERNSTRLAFKNINSNWTNLTRYGSMPEEERKLFLRLITNETSVVEDGKTYRNAIYTREVNQSTVSYLTDRKYFVYKNDIYFCGTVTPQGA